MNKPEQGASGAPTEQGNPIASWDWPELESPRPVAQSNALGYAPDWYRDDQQPEPESQEQEPEPQPLTLEEIEAIRQSAYEDGFNEGKEAGFAKGLEDGKLEGLQQGHAAGLAQGEAEGLALGQSLIDEQAAQWQALLSQLGSPLKQLDQQVEQQLLWLVMTLSKVLIKHEVHTSADLLLGSLKEAVKQLPCAEEGVTIELHPDDLALVVKAYGGEEECKKRGWTLIAEPALQRGDLQLQSRTSSIDLLLEQRIEQLLRNFMRTNADLLP